jgi:hypothetical protein
MGPRSGRDAWKDRKTIKSLVRVGYCGLHRGFTDTNIHTHTHMFVCVYIYIYIYIYIYNYKPVENALERLKRIVRYRSQEVDGVII